MLKYVFCEYDVWGDENDYEINDIMKYSEKPIYVHEDSSIDDILRVCAAEGFLNTKAVEDGIIDVDHSASPNYYEFWDLGTNLPFARVELVA